MRFRARRPCPRGVGVGAGHGARAGNEGPEGNAGFPPPAHGKPLDQSLLPPGLWPCPRPSPAWVFPDSGGLRGQGPVPAEKMDGKETKWGPWQKEEGPLERPRGEGGPRGEVWPSLVSRVRARAPRKGAGDGEVQDVWDRDVLKDLSAFPSTRAVPLQHVCEVCASATLRMRARRAPACALRGVCRAHARTFVGRQHRGRVKAWTGAGLGPNLGPALS